jgi:hypothetical protein
MTNKEEQHLGWQIFSQALVVILALVAVVVSLDLILNTYDVNESANPTVTAPMSPGQQVAATPARASQSSGQGRGSGGGGGGGGGSGPGSSQEGVAPVAAASPAPTSTSVSSSSVVAILTPIMAGIVGIAGLFFGVSATGSARGRQAGSEQAAANSSQAVADASQTVARASAKAIDLATQSQQEESLPAEEENGESKATQGELGDKGF